MKHFLNLKRLNFARVSKLLNSRLLNSKLLNSKSFLIVEIQRTSCEKITIIKENNPFDYSKNLDFLLFNSPRKRAFLSINY